MMDFCWRKQRVYGIRDKEEWEDEICSCIQQFNR